MIKAIFMKKNLVRFQSFLLIFVFSVSLLPNTGNFSLQAAAISAAEAKKKLATPLLQVVEGQITTANSWYEPNATEPFVQVLVQTFPQDTLPLRQAIKSVGGTVWTRYYSINGVDAWLPVNKVVEIARRTDVERLTPNYMTQESASSLEKVTGTSKVRNFNTATNQYTGADGTGVGIAVLDSGVMAENKGFNDANGNSRIKAQPDIAKLNTALQAFKNSQLRDRIPYAGQDWSDFYYGIISKPGVSFSIRNWASNVDKYGHGTFVAGVAAGRGDTTSNNNDFTGIAPNANIISVKVLDDSGSGQITDTIKGIDWVILHKNEYNIGVINLSLGGSSTESYLTDPLCRAVRKATAEGITVVVAAGNFGKTDGGQEMYGTVTSPANDPTVITVGSANTFQTNTRNDDQINTFSSRGPTRGFYTNSTGTKVYDNLIKPDLVAPGNKIISLESANNDLVLTIPSPKRRY